MSHRFADFFGVEVKPGHVPLLREKLPSFGRENINGQAVKFTPRAKFMHEGKKSDD